MTMLDEILNHNEKFVQEREYEKFVTTKYPDKRVVILTCMDTRLLELLPTAMNFRNGDVKIVKNAGAILSHPFGSIMRSIIVAIYELKAQEVIVVGHHDCGMSNIKADALLEKAMESGVKKETIDTLEYAGIHFHEWLKGFTSVTESVSHSVSIIRDHPLVPKHIPVHGLVIDPNTGKLDLVVDGYLFNEKD